MGMAATGRGPSARARLGSFEVDLRSGELRDLGVDPGASTILLREQPFQILRMLIERGGKLVTRAEIKKALWPNDTIVDFDHSINVAIGLLRRALGDSASEPRYIETLGRRGYRLLPAVEWPLTGADSGTLSTPAGPPTVARHPLGDLQGKKVGQYRVLGVLGGGGMGMVYEAEDLKLGRRVALKFLPGELASDPVALRRLEQEARTASALNHPNICTVFDIEEFEGQPFIVMELLDGETLLERIAASAPAPLPQLPLLDIAIQVCSGLQALHEKDIVHRDIKPANIFLTRQGPVKVLDFGVAKLVAKDTGVKQRDEQGATDGVSPVTQPGLTRTGADVGTTGYMSPEQVRKEALDARTDLFSLGVVLYEMATGRRAFPQEALAASAEPRPTATPPPTGVLGPSEPLLAAVPRALQRVLGKLLENEPARRYQTAAEVRTELERICDRVARPARWRSRNWIAGAVLVALVVAGGLWLNRTRPTVVLEPADTLIIAHLTNQTGDEVFDEALYTALRIALEQTPYLNVLADSKVRAALTPMNLGESTRVTPEIALQICRRTGGRVVVAQSIADAGNHLRLGLSAVDCRSGSTIGSISRDSASRNAVVHELGIATAQLRTLLGEPAQSIARFDAPLERATSASPEALQLLTLGYRRHLAGSWRDALPYYERAVRTDPQFAVAHLALSNAQANDGHLALSADSSRRAFELRDQLTLPERFNVESTYYRAVMGQEDRLCTVVEQWVQTFPHNVIARNNFAICLSDLGELDRSLGESREAARLLPAPWTYQGWLNRALLVDRLEEARNVYDAGLQRGFDTPDLRERRALVAFLEDDLGAMQTQWSWAEGRPAESFFLKARAMGEAFHGRFHASRQMLERADRVATEDSASLAFQLSWTLMRAEAGVREKAPAAEVTPDPRLPTRMLTVLTLARTGQLDAARYAADALRRDFPTHTLVRSYGLPLIDAAIRLESNDPAGAIEALRPAERYELSTWAALPGLYSAYLRGLAYLRMRDGRAATAEFQKVVTHRGLVERWAIGAMARLHLARAQHLTGADATALTSYEDFLRLWKDADDDLPLHQEARAEVRNLRPR